MRAIGRTKRLKKVTAGRLVYAVCYTQPMAADGPKTRAAKNKCSSEARKRMNLKLAWQKLEQLLAANFDRGDLMVTLTFDDEHLPPDRAGAQKCARRFLRLLREYRHKHGTKLEYCYCIERHPEESGGCDRLHIHMILNSTGFDYDIIRGLWEFGENVSFTRLQDYDSYETLAKYLTKEPRAANNAYGKRCWIPSKGLRKPEVTSEMVDDSLTLTAPPGAFILEREGPWQNTYGEFMYIKYLLPEPEKVPPKLKTD